MAKIQYSSLVNAMSGKLNGSVASRNKGGYYFRNKGIVSNPQTAKQMAVRGRFAAYSIAYSNISEEARQRWYDYAQLHPYTDIFGVERYLSAKAMFLKVATDRSLVGLNPDFEFPPMLVEPGYFESLALTVQYNITTDALSMVVDGDINLDLASNWRVMFYATPPLPASISYVKNKFRYIGAQTPVNTTALDANITSLYTAYFGNIIDDGSENLVVHVRCVLINQTGQRFGQYPLSNSVDLLTTP